MANTRSGNVIHVDTGGENITSTRINLVGVILTSANAGDILVLRDNAGTADKLTIACGVADDSKHIDLSESPITFNDGIRVESISAGAKAMLIISQAGGN